MTSRLDRLFSLLENCPNSSLRYAAAEQLGELVHSFPSNAEHILTRLVPLLRSRSWVSRLAASDVIRSVVRHLPEWNPIVSEAKEEPEDAKAAFSEDGFLSLKDLRLDHVLAQGARLYSMDARDLDEPMAKAKLPQADSSIADSGFTNSSGDEFRENEPPLSPLLVQRRELNNRLGLDESDVLSTVLATHSDVSVNDWITPDDLKAIQQTTIAQQDIAACIRSTYFSNTERGSKRSSSGSSYPADSVGPHRKHHRPEPPDENRYPTENARAALTTAPGSSDTSQSDKSWVLDNFCTLLLGDLWALRWETRHGAATGLRELLAESCHTKHCGKRSGMTHNQMMTSHVLYLEDIVVRVLCTLALDQLSDFISDEVVAPVRETAAQLLGVLSLHLSAEQVLLVSKHLTYLISLDARHFVEQSLSNPHAVVAPWKNSWMIVHGGLLGIKYLLASRKDLHSMLLPHVTPCLVAQLVGQPARTANFFADGTSLSENCGADEDIRSAAASALLPVVDAAWLTSIGTEHARVLIDRIWVMLRDITSDLSPSIGPLLQLASALTRAGFAQPVTSSPQTEHSPYLTWSVEEFSAQLLIASRLLHHTSLGIRQRALATLQCLYNTWTLQSKSLPPAPLQLLIDQLFHRVLLESNSSLRSEATKYCIQIVQSVPLSVLAQATVERLDFWLCQSMQPMDVPFPPHLFSATLPASVLHQTHPNTVHSTSDLPSKNLSNSQDAIISTNPPAAADSNVAHCIGGLSYSSDQPTHDEIYVWQTRICAIRILARLFARLCCYYPEGHKPVQPEFMSQPSESGPASDPPQPSVLCYFLNHLLYRLHLHERLAMQRSIGGLIIAAWAILPCQHEFTPLQNAPPETWAQRIAKPSANKQLETECLIDAELAVLCPSLKAKLEACLTEVVYYEEILGPFKLMQEECRRLVRSLSAAGYPSEPIFEFTGVRTIAQCSNLLTRAAQLINSPSSPSSSQSFGIASDQLDMLHIALDRTRATVNRCLDLQLQWGSWVEFCIASAFVNLDWFLQGRLSLLIRPLMDTIRCIQPISASVTDAPAITRFNSSGDPLSTLTPPSSVPQFQAMASACLAHLLHYEWRIHRQQRLASGATDADIVNPSRAAAKVVKNLMTSLFDSFTELFPSTTTTTTTESAAVPFNSVDTDSAVPDSLLPYPDEFKDLNADVLRTLPGSEQRVERFWFESQRRGSALALAHLCHTFLRSPDLAKSDESTGCCIGTLQRGLPSLWDALWTDPLRRLICAAQPNQTLPLADTTASLHEILKGNVLELLQKRLSKADEDALCSSFLALISCVPALLPFVTDSGALISIDQMVYVGTIASLLSQPRLRILGSRLLTSLSFHCPVVLPNLLVPLVLSHLEPELNPVGSRLCTCTHGALETVSVLLESLSSGPTVTSYWTSTTIDPLSDPEAQTKPSPLLGDADDNANGLNELPESLRCFLPYLALFVPPVLRLLADSDVQIRSSAGRLFAILLSLFPFEVSAPDPPEMDPVLSCARVSNRNFIDGLLHPDHIQAHSLSVPIRAHLRGYQQDGVNWLNFLNRFGLNGILCDDLGLGKTLQTICILADSHYRLRSSREKPGRNIPSNSPVSLVVCPSTLCGHWSHELQQFVRSEDLSTLVYAGTPTVRQGLQAQVLQHDLVITSYDTVRNDVQFFQSIFWNYVVLDEGHIIKSSKSKVARALKQLRAMHRLILTGTPIQNRVCELWSLFDFLMPDFLGSEANFAAKFGRPVAASRDPRASKAEQHAGHLALENLHRLVLPFMLRRLKEDVVDDLPPKIVQDYACEMTEIQAQLYEAYTKSSEGQQLLLAIRTKRDGAPDRITERTGFGFQALRYLQAVCNHPWIAMKPGHPLLVDVKRAVQAEFGPNTPLTSVHLSGKLLGFCRLLTDCGFGTPLLGTTTSTGAYSCSANKPDIDTRNLMSQHRALIFFQTREMLELTSEVIRTHFPWITFTRLDGSVPVSERHNRVMRFNQDPSIDLILLTTTVGGLGLNLTGADTVIFVEHDWNPCKDLQAMDRAHRIGQRRTVSVYRLITQDSIEEQIMNLQAFKLHLANSVITADNRSLIGMDTAHLFDRFSSIPSSSDAKRSESSESEPVDSFESAYEAEYNLEAFVSKLKRLH
ncbi:unnamed protein product [Dicrocoelium dendriticum]|nr:unnamed protein product [Dicrocoelium dendriticum]